MSDEYPTTPCISCGHEFVMSDEMQDCPECLRGSCPVHGLDCPVCGVSSEEDHLYRNDEERGYP